MDSTASANAAARPQEYRDGQGSGAIGEHEFRSDWQDQVRLPYDRETCLAYARASGECLLRVGDFNRNVVLGNFIANPEPIPEGRLDRIRWMRRKTIAALSHELYLKGFMQENAQESLAFDLRGAWESVLSQERKSIGEARLRELYKRHSKRFFASRREYRADVLGASDSLFLDSLRRTILADGALAKLPGRQSEASMIGGSAYPWQTFSRNDLPYEIAAVLDSLPGDSVPLPLRCRFGWFISRTTGTKTVPPMGYEEAIPILIAMALLPLPPPLKSGATPEGGDPEPVPGRDRELKAWLLPRSRTSSRSYYRARWSDTSRVAPMRLRLSEIPAPWRPAFLAALDKHEAGIITNRWGVWYFLTQASEDRPGMHPLAGVGAGMPLRQEAFRDSVMEFALNRENEFRISHVLNALQDGKGAPERYEKAKRKWILDNVAWEDRLLAP